MAQQQPVHPLAIAIKQSTRNHGHLSNPLSPRQIENIARLGIAQFHRATNDDARRIIMRRARNRMFPVRTRRGLLSHGKSRYNQVVWAQLTDFRRLVLALGGVHVCEKTSCDAECESYLQRDGTLRWLAHCRRCHLQNMRYVHGADAHKVARIMENSYNSIDRRRRFRVLPGGVRVTAGWILWQAQRQGMICSNGACGQRMVFRNFRMNDPARNTKVSVDRLNNNYGHYIQNCRLVCCQCNIGRRA